jgi:hypothetical protein
MFSYSTAPQQQEPSHATPERHDVARGVVNATLLGSVVWLLALSALLWA